MPRTHLLFAAGVLAVPAIVAPSPAWAQRDLDQIRRDGEQDGPVVLGDGDLDRLVQELDSEDASTRELATQILASDPRLSLRDLERHLAAQDLTREQRRRLLGAAFERFRPPNPRGALGVSFEPLAREAGVRIATVVPTFPSAAVLKPGDRVVSFDGIAIRDQQHAVAIIVSRDPGDQIEVAIVRDGEAMTLGVPLGRRDLLDNPVPVSGPMLSDAWAVRSRGYTTEPEPVVIDTGLAPGAWLDSATPVLHPGPVVIAGGEARGGFDPALAMRDAQLRPGLDATIIRPVQNGRVPDLRAVQNENLAIQRRLLRDQIDSLHLTINNLRQVLRQGVSPERRRQIERQIQEHLDVIRKLDGALRVVESQMGTPR